ncbi:MAG TPA: DUF3014 domain-containing protein [Vicinamibacterales bacterium]|jgi:hypothetical protein|nr:DUF3014 domain-containing protein [Vicinamibacterales bacterium]
MSAFQEYELEKTSTESLSPEPPETHPVRRWIVPALATVAAALAVYFLLIRRPAAPAPVSTGAPKAAPASSSAGSLGGPADQVDVPPLDDSDPLVRTMVRSLSSNPTIAKWLATNNLIRNFVVSVTNVADGASPSKHLTVLRPSSQFQIFTRDGRQYIDPRSYDRYTPIADAVASIDASGAARLYATLKPRIEDANRELGVADGGFDRTLERALVTLLSTPVVSESIRVGPKGIGYGFADERLEDLTAAQKQLARMGPRNVERIEGKLRELAIALGIPAGELPAGSK